MENIHLYYLNIRKIKIFLKVANLLCEKRKNRLHIQSDMRIKFHNKTKSNHYVNYIWDVLFFYYQAQLISSSRAI